MSGIKCTAHETDYLPSIVNRHAGSSDLRRVRQIAHRAVIEKCPGVAISSYLCRAGYLTPIVNVVAIAGATAQSADILNAISCGNGLVGRHAPENYNRCEKR